MEDASIVVDFPAGYSAENLDNGGEHITQRIVVARDAQLVIRIDGRDVCFRVDVGIREAVALVYEIEVRERHCGCIRGWMLCMSVQVLRQLGVCELRHTLTHTSLGGGGVLKQQRPC